MTFKAKPLRSVLFVPGNKEDWMRKAPKYGVDALILDLEDSVPLQEKAEARTLVGKMLKELGAAGQTLFVRVNELSTGMTADDIEAIACDELYGVILPKVTGPADVVETDILLKLFESRAGSQVGKTFIDPSLETAQGLRQAYEVAMASPRVAHMGASGGRGGDTARALGVPVDAGRHGDPFRPLQGSPGLTGCGSSLSHHRRLVRHTGPGRPASPRPAGKRYRVRGNAPHPPLPRACRQRSVHSQRR